MCGGRTRDSGRPKLERCKDASHDKTNQIVYIRKVKKCVADGQEILVAQIRKMQGMHHMTIIKTAYPIAHKSVRNVDIDRGSHNANEFRT